MLNLDNKDPNQPTYHQGYCVHKPLCINTGMAEVSGLTFIGWVILISQLFFPLFCSGCSLMGTSGSIQSLTLGAHSHRSLHRPLFQTCLSVIFQFCFYQALLKSTNPFTTAQESIFSLSWANFSVCTKKMTKGPLVGFLTAAFQSHPWERLWCNHSLLWARDYHWADPSMIHTLFLLCQRLIGSTLILAKEGTEGDMLEHNGKWYGCLGHPFVQLTRPPWIA